MHSVPHKGGSRSPEKENHGAQTELAGASLFALNGHSVASACHQTPGNEDAGQRGPAVRGQAAKHWNPFPDPGQRRTASHRRAYSQQWSHMPDRHLCIVRQDYSLAGSHPLWRPHLGRVNQQGPGVVNTSAAAGHCFCRVACRDPHANSAPTARYPRPSAQFLAASEPRAGQ
jgi:hypothetical protein